MNEMDVGPLDDAALREAVRASIEHEGDIRGEVRRLTLHALRDRQIDPDSLRAVMKSVTEGISLGAERRTQDLQGALREAVAGLDDAMSHSTEAMRLALNQLLSQGKDLTQNELRDLLQGMRRMEGEFVGLLSETRQRASARVAGELLALVTHLQRTGTDTGARVAATWEQLGNRLTANAIDGGVAGVRAAHEVSRRMALLAAGFLSGLADSLEQRGRRH